MPFTPIEWPVNSEITLCRVPWDAAYRDLVRFPSESARDSYFSGIAGEGMTLENMTYLKPNEPISVDVPYSKAYTYNYLVVRNPEMPVEGETTPPVLYYFITGCTMVNPSNTTFTVQLDIWQTYCFDVRFGSCFVERSHAAVQAECNINGNSGTIPTGYENMAAIQRYCTVSEGLDIGNEYPVVDFDAFEYAPKDERTDSAWCCLFNYNADLLAESYGTRENPLLDTADGYQADGLFTGNGLAAVFGINVQNLMDKLKDYPWISKGITSIMAFPSALLEFGNEIELGQTKEKARQVTSGKGGYYTFARNFTEKFGNGLPQRYAHLHKFYTFPYAIIELDANAGNSLLLKPELLPRTFFTARKVVCGVPPFARLSIVPIGYGGSGTDHIGSKEVSTSNLYSDVTVDVDAGFNMNASLTVQNFPRFATVNDEYANYLASTANTREYQYQAAGWQNSKSNAAASLSYQQSMQQLATNQQNRDVQNLMGVANTALSAGTGLVGGFMAGNVPGAVMGAVGGGLGAGINLWGQNEMFGNNQQLAETVAGQNRDMALWANRGDYQNAIKAINATVQDAALTQPSQSGQMGGEGFNLATGYAFIRVSYRMPDRNHVRVIGEYWLRYGYAVHEFMVPPVDLKCMSKATYWKMLETYITCASASEDVKDAIRGIFERGTTVWTNPDEIGNIDWGENVPADEVSIFEDGAIVRKDRCY